MVKIYGLLTATVLAFSSINANAQIFGAGPVRLIAPVQAGSAGDLTVRLIAPAIAQGLKQQIIIENVTGASGLIGARQVAKSTPDGSVIASFGDNIINYAPALTKDPGIRPLEDFEAITLLAEIPWVLVGNPDIPAKSIRELVDYAKSTNVLYSSPGVGTAQHFAMLLFSQRAKVQLTHVPYKGAAQAVTDVIGGHVQLAFTSISAALEPIKAGTLRAYAVPSSARSLHLPDVPTFAESGILFEFGTWQGLYAPKGMSAQMVNALNAEAAKALQDPNTQQRMRASGLEPRASTPAELAQRTKEGFERVVTVAKEAGIEPQ